MTRSLPQAKSNGAQRRSSTALADPPEPNSPTGRYPAPVWAQARRAKALAETEAPVPEPASATGRYPGPVWDTAVSVSAGLAVADGALNLKEQDYADEIGAAPDAETAVPSASADLDNREIYRIVREVAVSDSGTDLYAAVTTQNGFGLCFGLLLFTQASGHLGAALELMRSRDEAKFQEVFGEHANELLSVTTSSRPQDRLAPVAGEPLTSQAWQDRFRQAGTFPAFHAAQNEQAIEHLFRPMLRFTNELGINTDRSLAMAFDRLVTRGIGGGIRWILKVAGPLRTAEQRNSALSALGFDDLPDFQQSVAWVPSNGIFGPETHAALVGALRRAGEVLLPSADDYMSRMLAAATGAARQRLERLRTSDKLSDIVYRLPDE